MISPTKRLPPTIVFIFGGSGDLNFRKLTPALYNLFLDGYLPEHFAVVGLGRSPYTDETFRQRLLEGVQQFSRRKGDPETDWKPFAHLIAYLSLDAGKSDDFPKIAKFVKDREKAWNETPNVLFYFAVAPQLVPDIATKLNAMSLCRDKEHVRIVVEKPFGHDLESARELNRLLGGLFAEEQIYRIDHYLGKETVQNILALRFANTLFEPIWNRQYIDHIQITASETVGLEGRADYYETAGALRDMVQNHILQLLCMVAMDAPVSYDANEIRNKKVDVLNAIRKIPTDDVRKFAVRGQYSAGTIKDKDVVSYREEKGVSPQSATETFAAVKFFVDNWRWNGVPFYVRTGKFLPKKMTVITVQFKPAPPYSLPEESSENWQANRLTISIQPEMAVTIQMQAKRPGQGMILNPVNMVFNYRDAYDGNEPEAYETLLLDAMEGDATLFMRADQVDAAWRVVTPILEAWGSRPPVGFANYAPMTWGPEAAQALIAHDGHHWVNE